MCVTRVMCDVFGMCPPFLLSPPFSLHIVTSLSSPSSPSPSLSFSIPPSPSPAFATLHLRNRFSARIHSSPFPRISEPPGTIASHLRTNHLVYASLRLWKHECMHVRSHLCFPECLHLWELALTHQLPRMSQSRESFATYLYWHLRFSASQRPWKRFGVPASHLRVSGGPPHSPFSTCTIVSLG